MCDERVDDGLGHPSSHLGREQSRVSKGSPTLEEHAHGGEVDEDSPEERRSEKEEGGRVSFESCSHSSRPRRQLGRIGEARLKDDYSDVHLLLAGRLHCAEVSHSVFDPFRVAEGKDADSILVLLGGQDLLDERLEGSGGGGGDDIGKGIGLARRRRTREGEG